MTIKPFDFQNHAHWALRSHVHYKPKENPIVILPTGTGKSVCLAMFIYDMLTSYPYLRMMMCTHVKELIEGNYNTLMKLWPGAPAGIYSAGLGQKDVYSQVTFAGIQSVASKPGRFGKIDFLLIDEAHLVGTSDSANYVKFINALRGKNPNLIVIGFTATAFRMGLGSLTEGGIFDAVAFDGGSGEAFVWFIENGYLIRPIPCDPGVTVDDSGVGLVGGDFNNKEASAAFRNQGILEQAVDTILAVAKAENRQAMLTFCQSIEDAELVADMFKYKGRHVEAVHSKRGDRDDVLDAFSRGELWGVTNRDILTTGYNNPRIDLMGILRLTRSPGLWVQMLGRGTRPSWVGHIGHNGGPPMYDITTLAGRLASIQASHKHNCRVLDFAGNTMRLGPINYPVLPKRRGKGGGEAPTRKCPVCKTYLHTSVNPCSTCGYMFPIPEKIKQEAAKDLLVIDLAELPEPEPRLEEIFGVHRMVATHNEGKGRGEKKKLDTMRVDYMCGYKRFSTWVAFEHKSGSWPRRQAELWWKRHGGQGDAPTTIAEAVDAAGSLKCPKFLKVWTNTKFPEILDYDHRGTRFELPPEAGGPPLQEPEPDPIEQMQYSRAAAGEMYYDDDLPF